jgi:hypothetical protein
VPGKPKQLPAMKPPKSINPTKAVRAAPRLRPTTTRDYGKGGTPLSGAPDMGQRGAGIGFVGPGPEDV